MKQSAGTLLYRHGPQGLEVLIVHPSGWYKVRYHVPAPPPTLAVIVMDTGDVPALQRCISALSTHTFLANCEVVVVGMDESRECPPFPCGRGTARRLAIPHATDLVDFANRAAPWNAAFARLHADARHVAQNIAQGRRALFLNHGLGNHRD